MKTTKKKKASIVKKDLINLTKKDLLLVKGGDGVPIDEDFD